MYVLPCYLCKLLRKVVTYLVSYLKRTLVRATQFIADGRETFVTLLKISNRYTCYPPHKSQGRIVIHTVLIMQLCQSELLNDVELVDTWLATGDPVRAHSCHSAR